MSDLPFSMPLPGSLNACFGPAAPKVRRANPDLNLGGLSYGRYRLPFMPAYVIHYITLVLLMVPLVGREIPIAISASSLCLALAIYCTKMPLAAAATGRTVENYNPRDPLTYLEFDGQLSRTFPRPLTTDLLSWGLVDYACLSGLVVAEALALSLKLDLATQGLLASILVVSLVTWEIAWLTRVHSFTAPATVLYKEHDQIRQLFRQFLAVGERYPEQKPKTGHSHPHSAAERNAASMSLDAYILKCGMRPYVFQASQRDVKSGTYDYSVTHKPEVIKLGLQPEHSDPVKDDSFIKMVDVDYYTDMYMMLWMAIPIVAYSFQPQAPAGASKDMTWTIDTDNKFVCHLNGGGKYRHQVWDYEPDEICATYYGVTYYYSVERMRVSDSHSFVLLAPRYSSWTGLPDGMTLRPLSPVKTAVTISSLKSSIIPYPLIPKSVALMVVKTEKGENLAMCAPLSSYSAVIPMSIASAIQAAHTITPMMRHMLNSLLKLQLFESEGEKLRLDANQIVVVTEQCLPVDTAALHNAPKVSHSTATMESTYHRQQKTGNDVPVIGGRVLTKPIYGHAMIPNKSRENDEWALGDRVFAPSNSAQFPAEWNYILDAFLKKSTTPLTPLTFQELDEAQSKPSQRSNNAFAAATFGLRQPDCQLESFPKAEIHGSVKAPRNITTLPPHVHYTYGTYTHAVAKHMKTWPCYAFGKTPQEVGEAVRSAASYSTVITETDFSTFDGTHSDHMTWFELAFLIRCFNSFASALTALFNTLRGAKARTASGIEYEKGGSRLSGSDDTSIFNTLINMLTTYITLCLSGHSLDTSWDLLQLKGVFGGDDGLMGDLDPVIYQRVVNRLGLKLKANRKLASSPCNMLGRVYPYPQTCSQSVADIPRQARKLHLTTDKIYTDAEVLYNKACGIMSTDSDTPVLKDWAKAILRIVGEQRTVRTLQPYTLMSGDFEMKLTPEELLDDASRQLDVSVTELVAFAAACDGARTLDELPTLCHTPDVLIPTGVVCGGIVTVPSEPVVTVKRPPGWRQPSKKQLAATAALTNVITPPVVGPGSLPGARQRSADENRGVLRKDAVKSKRPQIIPGNIVDTRADRTKPIKFADLVSDQDKRTVGGSRKYDIRTVTVHR